MRSLIWCAALSMIVLSPPTETQVPDAGRASVAVALTPASVITRQIETGETHRYSIELDADTFFEVSVSQPILIKIAMIDPDGAAVAEIDLPSADPLPERLMVVTRRAGTYRVDVSIMQWAFDKDRVADSYTLRVVAAQPATGRDRRRERCFVTTAQGAQLAKRGRTMVDFAVSLDMLKAGAACWQAVSDVEMEMATLSSFAQLSSLYTEFRVESAAAYERLLPLLRANGHTDLELALLDDLVVEYNDDGRFDRGREMAVVLQQLAAQLGNRQREGRAYQRIGYSEYSLGNYTAARRAAVAAEDIGKETRDTVLLGQIQLLLGRIDDLAGDYDAALARYEQGLRANPEDRGVTPALLNALGFLHLRRGEHQEAARQFEARLAIGAKYVNRDTEALARVGLGDVRLARGDKKGALELYAAAAEALKNGAPYYRCIALQRLGRRALDEGRLDEAAAHFAAMLAGNQQVRHPPCEAEAQAGTADVAAARGDLERADAAARQVIEIAEQFREAAPSLESRALGFGALAPAFSRAVEISMRLAEQGDREAAARALVLNERALARGLLDHLAGPASDESPLLPDALALERQRIREQWRVRVAQYQVAALSRRDGERAKTLREEMTALELQLRDLDARGDLADQRRARLIRPAPLELGAIQALLDEDTILIEYALGERQSYMWIVSSRDMHVLRLAPRAEIDAAARAVHRDLTTPAGPAQPEAAARRRELSRLVIAPAASLLSARRLVIVSAGALSLIPFSVLPFEGEGGDRSTLLSRFEIVHTPSATTLAAMRALTERRPRPTRHTVVFADPIFEAADPRAARRSAAGEKPPGTTSSEIVAARTATALGASFPRLPFSRAEANALSALAPGQVTSFVDGMATRDRALGRALGDYRFIHFATHGIVHPEVPRLSSIVLSFVDGSGARRDPFLTLPDIYEMRVSADVVVLSACSTAEGRHVPGEGPIGLARAFMYAGAPRVIASFWRVNDMATAELMKHFYRGVLVDGLPAAAALRAAQHQVAAIPRWRSPYYWAPFVLHGDWR
jgi:CHAT domain-containing protein